MHALIQMTIRVGHQASGFLACGSLNMKHWQEHTMAEPQGRLEVPQLPLVHYEGPT
jgi:hypothetical protein